MPDDAEWSARLNALVASANAREVAAQEALTELTLARQRLRRLAAGQISSSPRLLQEMATAIDRAVACLELPDNPEEPYLDHAPGPGDAP